MKTLKILPNALMLLQDVLLANKLEPEKLQATLGKYIATLEMYRESNLINNEVEMQMVNEITEGTEGFLIILELCTLIMKVKKIKP